MVKAKLTEAYEGLSHQALLEETHKLAANYDRFSGSCSQTPVAALCKILGFDDSIVRVATSLCGGTALQFVGTCGALSGGVMVLDYYSGRPMQYISDVETIKGNAERLQSSFELPRLLASRFISEYGTIICTHLQLRLFGRLYYNADSDEYEKYLQAGGHSDPSKCIGIVGNVARWVLEILLDRGVIK
jgi:C_GCAxxG_C_C family probable redox protein